MAISVSLRLLLSPRSARWVFWSSRSVSYVLLYRRFDRVTLQPAVSRSADASDRSLARWSGRAPVRHAIGRFIAITIRRSPLHQGLVVGLLAAAGGFVLNSLLNASGWHDPTETRQKRALINTLLWAPMTMVFLAVPAMRLAMWIPLDLRANWVFRLTEDEAGRAEVAAANLRAVWALAVKLPLALHRAASMVDTGTVSPSAYSSSRCPSAGCSSNGRWPDWQRIPFTCSYLPGKGFVPHMFVKGFASFVFFSTASVLVLRISLARPIATIVFAAIFSGTAGLLAVLRARHARESPLIFEDELPTDVNPLRLNAD